MSKKDMAFLIKSWKDIEAELDVLIAKQKLRLDKLLEDLKEINGKD